VCCVLKLAGKYTQSIVQDQMEDNILRQQECLAAIEDYGQVAADTMGRSQVNAGHIEQSLFHVGYWDLLFPNGYMKD